jgi:hypothetical protein
MNSNETVSSTPSTIQNIDNYLKDYVNTSGFQWNSTCLDVVFKNLENDSYIKDLVTKVGDYNTVTATNPQYTPPRSYQEKDYSGRCPEGWTSQGWWGGCVNPNYTGSCNAGRTKKTKRPASCPTKIFGNPDNYLQQYSYWSWGWWPGWRGGSYWQRNNNSYSGWNGPTDAEQGNFINTNIGKKYHDEGSFCTAGWSAGNSMGGAQADCAISGGQWVNYYNDPGFWSNGYTCYKPTQYDSVTEPPSYFNSYNNEQKRSWENSCQAYWPMKTINIPGKWTCQYQANTRIEDDIARGNIFQIGSTSSPIEAARMALRSNRMVDNYFFMLDNNIYIVGRNSNINVITSKGTYQPNCTELNNRKGTLYVISTSLIEMLNKCKVVNDKINSVNESRDVLQNAVVGSIKENFTNLDNIKDISQNQNEITANLVSNYNKKAELYNYQVDLIGQNEKLVENHNKKLNKQLDDLTAIQEQIALKDRVIELNDELTKKQIRNKKILIGFFVLIPLLGIPLLLVVTNAFSPFIGIGIAGLMIVGYIIYMIVVANQSDVKKFGREDKRIISKYEKSLLNYWNKQKEKLSQSLSKFVNGQCADDGRTGTQEEEEESSGGSSVFPKGDYLMKSNGPFYYYDGSAPPQQIYPGATGSINFNIEGENQKFPNIDFSKIKNPVTKFFFMIWIDILLKNDIKLDDPRFNEVLDVIDFPDSDQTPMPFWDNIKLPIVTNINQQFNYLFQSYSKEKKNLSQTASVLLIDLWNFIFGDKIPGDIYEIWVKKLADVVKQDTPDIDNFYSDYLDAIIQLPKFSEKYGSGNVGLEKFVELKMVDFIKTFNQDISVSQPFAKRYVP